MPFKFEFPVSLPRFTSEEFEAKKAAYNAKYGYKIHIPGFSDIIKFDTIDPPTAQELQYYADKDFQALGEDRSIEVKNFLQLKLQYIYKWEVVPEPTFDELSKYEQDKVIDLGEKRYNEIKTIMDEKRALFLRMMSSPTPPIARNAANLLTFFDDINDTLGTLAVAGRIVANRLPSQLAKFIYGPSGWLFAAADIANVGLSLSQLPWKARRLQHELHHAIKDHPLSKKARLKHISRLKRTGISKGELIEALQTTDNVFGFGLCLGPLMSMVYDIPFGLYRHIKGHEVTIHGLPAPFYWFDRIWSRGLRSIAQIWSTGFDLDDKLLGKSMVAFNICTQIAKSFLSNLSPLDILPDISDVEVPVSGPYYPSTTSIILSEVPSIDEVTFWPTTGTQWMKPTAPWEDTRDIVTSNIKSYLDRNRHDVEAMVCSQNAVEAGQNSLAILEGDEAVEFDFETTAMSILKLLNSNYRFPDTATQENAMCFFNQLKPYDENNLQLELPEILSISQDKCGFQFTTEVPARSTTPYFFLAIKHSSSIYRLQRWYFSSCLSLVTNITGRAGRYRPDLIPYWETLIPPKRNWLLRNGWDMAQVQAKLDTWTQAQEAAFSQ